VARSRDLAVELADLVDHFPPQFGRIVRALFSPPVPEDWLRLRLTITKPALAPHPGPQRRSDGGRRERLLQAVVTQEVNTPSAGGFEAEPGARL
jgi:hypothetical protein